MSDFTNAMYTFVNIPEIQAHLTNNISDLS